MKKVLVSFANEKYYRSLDILEKTSLEIGKVDKMIKYTQESLKNSEFWKKNQYILSKPRGCGYWIWKPYIILDALNNLSEGDIVMYSDAGVSVIDDLSPLFEIASSNSSHGMMLFANGEHKNYTWTKKDCFALMGCDSEEYWNGQHLTATTSVWVNNKENIEFLKEYQRYLRDPRIVTDDPNMFGANRPQFKDHRHDQSVLSIMAIKHKTELYRDPSQFGLSFINEFQNSPYKQLTNHHRGNI